METNNDYILLGIEFMRKFLCKLFFSEEIITIRDQELEIEKHDYVHTLDDKLADKNSLNLVNSYIIEVILKLIKKSK